MRALKLLSLALGASTLLGLTLGLAWMLVEIATDGQSDDEIHLVAKTEYLERIASLPEPGLRPNVVFILFDDLGYGDLGFTGSKAIATPRMDQLASDGLVLNQFYSPSPICTPARAGYLTGRLPLRAGMPQVVFPTGTLQGTLTRLGDFNKRIPAEEITIAEVLAASGYATGMVGKWHLGDRSPSLPNDMGFQSYFGALYSNDMTPFALYRDRDIAIEAPADQTRLNEWYGDAAEEFIELNAGQPFFLYLAHNFPHIPLFRPEPDVGRSRAGLYGDVVEGLDDLVGRVIDTLERRGVLDNTLVIVTSDNGPWFQGSPGASRGRKGDTFEGGMHVPMLLHWPAQLSSGERDGMSMGIDLFPTLLDWLELPLPEDRLIDGRSLRTMLEQDQPSPHEYLYYFAGSQLMAVRDPRFKYHEQRAHPYIQAGSSLALPIPQEAWLIDGEVDVDESYDVSERYPQETQRMRLALEAKREEMESNLRGWR